MHLEIARTFPISRNHGYEYMREMSTWSVWSPITVGEDEDTFTFTPIKGVSYTGTMSVVEEVPNELCAFVLESKPFPAIDMKWNFSHAGPGAFTLRLELSTESTEWTDRLLETITFLGPSVKMAVMSSLDKLEHHFLGDLEEEKIPAMAE